MFSPNLFEDAGPARGFFERMQRRGAGIAQPIGGAGASYLQAHNDPRFGVSSARDAADFDDASNRAAMAVGAPAGSIAARSNPMRFGSIESRQFPTMFNQNTTAGFDAYNHAADPSNPGMMRRKMYQSLTQMGGDDDGSGS